jgi:hypothetical protein
MSIMPFLAVLRAFVVKHCFLWGFLKGQVYKNNPQMLMSSKTDAGIGGMTSVSGPQEE